VIETRLSSSFRDPSGFVSTKSDEIYRQINEVYAPEYEHLIKSGLYQKLVAAGLLVPHEELDWDLTDRPNATHIIKPEKIPFISYPYEWCFSQLQDAALATLQIQQMAMEKGMTLKDCSAYNIQFKNDRPVFIDTLSFAKYEEGDAWVAYRQFCQHFLAPLALMAYTDVRLSQLLRVYIDGVPLDLASALLPRKTKFKMSLLIHIHMHAGSQRKHSDSRSSSGKKGHVSKAGLLGIISSIKSAIQKLEWKPHGTEWGDYYDDHNYTDDSIKHKADLVERFIEQADPSNVWDLGGNTGVFSRIASYKDIPTVSFDIDPAAVEKNYRVCREKSECHILPLLLDLTNPSPSLGWASTERHSIIDRGPADTVLSLALVHHLAIGNNVPLGRVAEFFTSLCKTLIIEFVPKSDSQVERMLSTREDVFPLYTKEGFEAAFEPHFKILDQETVGDSTRTLYLMKNLTSP